jgi:hypothetical protein
MLLSHFAGQATVSQVFPRCLRVHARLRRRYFQRQFLAPHPPKPLYLLIAHHTSCLQLVPVRPTYPEGVLIVASRILIVRNHISEDAKSRLVYGAI